MKLRGTWQLKGRTGIILGLVAVASAVSGVAFFAAKGAPQQQRAAASQSAPASTPAAAPAAAKAAPTGSTAYREGVVAYLYNGTPVTREQLGEYLIDRFGGERLEPFINKAIVERACQERKITVDPGEVDADLAETLRSVPGDKKQFLDNLLRQKQMTLKEWKDDVVRPKLLLTKYCRDRAKYSDEDVLHAYESMYGAKVRVQLIIWTPDEVKKNRPADVYKKICEDKDEFDQEARGQWDKKLAATAGQLQPFGRYSQQNKEMEELAFKMKEGEITPVLSLFPGEEPEKIGCYVMKCLKHIPADPNKKLEDVRADLERELKEVKLRQEIGKVMDELRKAADPKFELVDSEDGEKRLPPGTPDQVVATIHGNVHLTREQFGEYLIDRYGADRLDLFLNRLIIDHACKAEGITASKAEIDEQLGQYIVQFAGGDKKTLVNRMLKPNKATLYELRNDVLWTKILLGKYCRDRVQVTEAELKLAYDSHYGEKVKVRMIMWPKEEEKMARIKYYPLVRDDDKEFIRLAKQQMVPELASKAGETEIARHASGLEEVEKVAFELDKGDISPILALPECVMVFRVLDRVPAEKDVKMEDVRQKLIQEVTEAKLRAQVIPTVYAELRKEANPILLLKNQFTEDELKREVVRELMNADKSIIKPRKPETAGPNGN
jgi:hypothetical protein